METIKEVIESKNKRDLSMSSVARKLGVTNNTMTNWNKRPGSMRLSDVHALSVVLNIALCKLMNRVYDTKLFEPKNES